MGQKFKSLKPLPGNETILLDREQVARILGVSTVSLWRWEQRGVLTPLRINKTSPGGKVFYRRADIDALINGTAPTTSTPRAKLLRQGGR